MSPKEFKDSLREYRANLGRKNRARGEAFEFEVLREYKDKSDFAIRSAGSHSIIDIVARQAGKLIYINCKINGYREQHELKALARLKAKLVKNEIIILANRIGGKIQYNRF